MILIIFVSLSLNKNLVRVDVNNQIKGLDQIVRQLSSTILMRDLPVVFTKGNIERDQIYFPHKKKTNDCFFLRLFRLFCYVYTTQNKAWKAICLNMLNYSNAAATLFQSTKILIPGIDIWRFVVSKSKLIEILDKFPLYFILA